MAKKKKKSKLDLSHVKESGKRGYNLLSLAGPGVAIGLGAAQETKKHLKSKKKKAKDSKDIARKLAKPLPRKKKKKK